MRAIFSGDVLIVEDNVIIAMDLEGMVKDLGAIGTHHARTVDEALALIEIEAFRAAILDYDLASGTSIDVADALAARNIPFVFATGHVDLSILPERFQAQPTINKPYTEDEIIEAFEAL